LVLADEEDNMGSAQKVAKKRIRFGLKGMKDNAEELLKDWVILQIGIKLIIKNDEFIFISFLLSQ
jgi:hypothetical protein